MRWTIFWLVFIVIKIIMITFKGAGHFFFPMEIRGSAANSHACNNNQWIWQIQFKDACPSCPNRCYSQTTHPSLVILWVKQRNSNKYFIHPSCPNRCYSQTTHPSLAILWVKQRNSNKYFIKAHTQKIFFALMQQNPLLNLPVLAATSTLSKHASAVRCLPLHLLVPQLGQGSAQALPVF